MCVAYMYEHSCVHGHTHMSVDIHAHVHAVEARGCGGLSSSMMFHHFCRCRVSHLNIEITESGGLANQLAPGNPTSASYVLWVPVLGIPMLILMLPWQLLYPLSHLLSLWPSSLSLPSVCAASLCCRLASEDTIGVN